VGRKSTGWARLAKEAIDVSTHQRTSSRTRRHVHAPCTQPGQARHRVDCRCRHRRPRRGRGGIEPRIGGDARSDRRVRTCRTHDIRIRSFARDRRDGDVDADRHVTCHRSQRTRPGGCHGRGAGRDLAVECHHVGDADAHHGHERVCPSPADAVSPGTQVITPRRRRSGHRRTSQGFIGHSTDDDHSSVDHVVGQGSRAAPGTGGLEWRSSWMSTVGSSV